MYTNSGCNRLVDYYFVVSCDDRGIGHIKEKLQHSSLAPENEKTARHAQFALKPKIIDRYPSMNHIDTPLLPWVARTSMPRGIRARTRPPSPTFFTFVGWNIDTCKLYGACLMVFEKIHIQNQYQTVYIPKTLGFVSHYPYFCAFDVFLRCLWHVIPKKLIPLENLLIHYFSDIPAPAPSRKIAYDLGQMQVLLACRNEFDVPILELPMETAFTQLSKDRICFILKLLLLEQRIIFICGDMHQLTPVCELFVSLLFPLRWKHLYMPLLSHTMFQALMNSTKSKYKYKYKQNTPFIVGLPRFVYLNPEIQNNMPINSFLVFLDRNEITDYKKNIIHPNDMKYGKIVPNLPNPLENTLRDAIHTLARILTMQVDGIQSDKTKNNNNNKKQLQNNTKNENNNNNKTVTGGHNSMFISREYTLQAFRTMFAVMTKLLYLSAHKEYGNKSDNEEEENTKESKADKYSKTKFIIRFRITQLFQSFYKYYKRINGMNDPYFKRMYLFYKENEGHGKHFARRQQNIWENEPFDRKLYDREIFKISKQKIKQLETNNGKSQINKLKKLNEIATKRSKKFLYPTKEFEMLNEVKQFLEMYIWKKESKPKPKMKPNQINRNRTMDNQHVKMKGSNSNKSGKSSRRNSHMSHKSHKSHKSHRKNKTKKKHIIINNNSNDINNITLQNKLETFVHEITLNKDNIHESLKLCIDIESKIQKQMNKNQTNNNNHIKSGSIDIAAQNIGFKINNYDFQYYKKLIYDTFKEDIQGKHNLVTIIHKLCAMFPNEKQKLKLLRAVVDMFDDDLSLASISVKSLFLNQNGKSIASSTTTTTTTTTTTSDSASSWGDDNTDSSSSSNSSSNSSDSSGSDSTGSDTDNSSSDDDDDDSDSSSSGWSVSGGGFDDEKDDKEFDGHGGCKFTKLDEFTLDKQEIEWFDKCQLLHNQNLGKDGIKYINNCMANNKNNVGNDFIDDYIVDKWKKNYKQRLKDKTHVIGNNNNNNHNNNHNNNKPLLSPNPALNQQKSSDIAPFNINHSYNVYDADITNQYGALTATHSLKSTKSVKSIKSNKLIKYNKNINKKPLKSMNLASQTLSLRSLTNDYKSPKKRKSPKPPKPMKNKSSSPMALNISPKSAHSSKYYQHHDIMHYSPNGAHKTHHNNNNNHSNNRNSNGRKKKKLDNDVYVD